MKGPIPEDELGKLLFRHRCPGCDKDTDFELAIYVNGAVNICRSCGWRDKTNPVNKREIELVKLDASCPGEGCYGWPMWLFDHQHVFCKSCHEVFHFKLVKGEKWWCDD